MPEMTEQQTDQEALTAAIEQVGGVDEFWGGYKIWDHVFYKHGVYIILGIDPYRQLLIGDDSSEYNDTVYQEDVAPHAGTWAEGRIREAMGEKFRRLERAEHRWVCHIRHTYGATGVIREPTALGALIAGQVALLEGEGKADEFDLDRLGPNDHISYESPRGSGGIR